MLRRSGGLTQDQLAHSMGMTPQHLSAVERGVGNPTVAMIYALADALDVEVADLLPPR